MTNSAPVKQRQRLTINLEELFPGESIVVGGQTLLIRPLVAEQIATLITQAKGIGAVLSNEGVTWDNYNQPECVFTIATTLVTQFPDILEEVSNVHQDDLKALPIEVLVEVVDAVIGVNLKAKDSLVKNSKSLTTLFAPLMKKTEKDQELEEVIPQDQIQE